MTGSCLHHTRPILSAGFTHGLAFFARERLLELGMFTHDTIHAVLRRGMRIGRGPQAKLFRRSLLQAHGANPTKKR